MLWQDCQKQPPKTSDLEALLKKVAGLKACNFFKKWPQHMRLPVNNLKVLRLLIWKNNYEQLLFDYFNVSLLHGPKASSCRLYDGVRLQGLSHRSRFLFLSRHLSPWADSRHAFENLRRIPLMSQLILSWRRPLSYRNQSIDFLSKYDKYGFYMITVSVMKRLSFHILVYLGGFRWFQVVLNHFWSF